MSLNYSAAHSSRITKKRTSTLKRSASSPFATLARRKPIQRSKSKPESSTYDDEGLFDERLEDLGTVTTLAAHLPLKGVVEIVQYANSYMFEPMPERGGFNSPRIAEILNFRKSLPATATVAHVHALSTSPTVTEREIAQLARANVLRKIVVPGRGIGGSTVGESLVLFTDLETMLDRAEAVDAGLKEKLLQYLRSQPLSQNISPASFDPSEISILKSAGFLTSLISQSNPSTHSRIPSTPSTSLSAISRAASGSLAAIGGSAAVVDAGGTLGLRRSSSQYESPSPADRASDLQLALPNTGPYLRLLTEARTHLMSLIHKSGGFREIPVYLLRERWDGGTAGDDPASRAKKLRGEFAGVLPARTRKWRHFWGLKFDWVLAECVGSGMVELFETGSVGLGVRVT
ncbi:MAG: hypothetical protein L6R42_006737 [Xanthoria sp. 1 TBL-2021]|nr:MAG: hypothetical protein L6R42_006737 [Xanthoria sp. 1 TBL-2021]